MASTSKVERLGSEKIGKLLLEMSSQTTFSLMVYAIYSITDTYFLSVGINSLAAAGSSEDATLQGVLLDPYRNYRGAEVIGAWRWLPEYGMGIATEIDADEAFKPMNLLWWSFTGLLGLIGGPAGLLAWAVGGAVVGGPPGDEREHAGRREPGARGGLQLGHRLRRGPRERRRRCSRLHRAPSKREETLATESAECARTDWLLSRIPMLASRLRVGT